MLTTIDYFFEQQDCDRTIFGKNYSCKEISSKDANKIVKKYHYSGKVVSNSSIHLGIFLENRLVGCLSFGRPLNGDSTLDRFSESKGVELNRMVMDDDQPRNSESQAISLSIKWLKKYSDIEWLLSFSDGKEGNVGYIYQATNWKYLGYMLSDAFYGIDGQDGYTHRVTIYHLFKRGHELRDTHTTHETMIKTHPNFHTIVCKQHVYVFPLNRKVKFNYPFLDQYPKLENEIPILRKRTIAKDGELVREDVDYVEFPIIDLFGNKMN